MGAFCISYVCVCVCVSVCVRVRGCHGLTVADEDGRGGVTLALTLLHGGGPEGVGAVGRHLPRVGQTLDGPHLLAQAALGRTLGGGHTHTDSEESPHGQVINS